MKVVYSTLLATTLLGLVSATAQEGRQGPPPEGHRPPPPVIVALDVNKDGALDASEIANASTALLSLDANRDGQLTGDELHPPCPRCTGGKGPTSGEPSSRKPRRFEQ